MSKRRPSIDPSQLGFTFTPPVPASREADLAGLDRVVAASVAAALKDDPRSRHEVAGAVSSLLDDTVSKAMLDAYASEARDAHNISAGRLFAVIAVTKRFDLLDSLCRRIGAAVLVGEELQTARLGHLKAQRQRLDDEIRALRTTVQPIERGQR
ncbi:hypothetical protein [Sphingomonas sp. CROZ-RG-20F-R02-07]|uniref:hypothetical protein n=1 Tax=Sphingomonas sp. CROZ-RG-20F-R02-07 TaxID=2914832 RepID=UPI001F56746E|nr:hypothetical protein [Sphingomonas sp. CROZ-RG-20F-R02-07]